MTGVEHEKRKVFFISIGEIYTFITNVNVISNEHHFIGISQNRITVSE